jgi:hypothetical protein
MNEKWSNDNDHKCVKASCVLDYRYYLPLKIIDAQKTLSMVPPHGTTFSTQYVEFYGCQLCQCWNDAIQAQTNACHFENLLPVNMYSILFFSEIA